MNSFTIITPNLNMARFLPETIESVLINMVPGDQYFIIDGGSKDGSVEIIRHYESRLSGWVSEHDCGYADAIAKGFSRATGDYLCWINSGDIYLKGALNVARRFLSNTEADLIFGDDLYIDEQSRVISHSWGSVRSLRRMMLFGGWTPLQDACFWRRSLYDRVGGIDSTLKYAADYDFFLRASLAGQCVYVPKIFSAFRRHEGQKSIYGSTEYEAERQYCRRQSLRRQNVSGLNRVLLEPFYWVAVRWRCHVACKLRRSPVPVGILAQTMPTQPKL